MSLIDFGYYVTVLFTYELDRYCGGDVQEKPEDAAERETMQAAFQEIYPEAPVILGLAAEMTAGKSAGKALKSRFEVMVSQLENLLSFTNMQILFSGGHMKDGKLRLLYKPIASAFDSACACFPEDPEEEGYSYRWNIPKSR